jgi:uncharacterized protein
MLQSQIRVTGNCDRAGYRWGTVMFRCVYVFVAAAACLCLEGCSSDPRGTATGAGKTRDAAPVSTPSASVASSRKASVQTYPNTIRVVSGEENSTYSRTVIDLMTILDRDRFRFQPIPGRGPLGNLVDLLRRPDIRPDIDVGIVQTDALEALMGSAQADVAIVQTDALEALMDSAEADAGERLRYLFRVPNQELHVLALRDITEIRQLEGRKVNIDRPGSSTHLTARAMFDKLGIKAEFTTDDQATALQRLESGEIQAAISLASRPSREILGFPSYRSYGRFHLVSIPFEESVASYFPARFTADDYPDLVEAGRPIETIAVGRVLAVRDPPRGSSRYRRLTRLSEIIHARFDELKQTGHDPRWAEIDFSAAAPGWQRFEPAQNLLDRNARQAAERRAFRRIAAETGICSLQASASTDSCSSSEGREGNRAFSQARERD